MKWWLYIALKQLFPSGRKVSLFAVLGVLGVALGVLGLFGTQSVMNGFHEKIAVKLRQTTGDVIIRQGGRAMSDIDTLCASLKADKRVSAVEKVARGPVMMLADSIPVFPVLRSYDTVSGECALPMRDGFVVMGSIDDLDDDTIIVGQRLAFRNSISVGDTVEIYSPTMLDKIKRDEFPLPARLKVVGLLATDYSEVDANVAIVSLRRMRDLYGLGNGTHEIILRLKDGVDAQDFARVVREKYIKYPRTSQSWLSSNEAFLNVIAMEKTMMSMIILLIIVVAAFSICICLYMSVLRKTREIGLMGAMGAKPAGIAATYCFQGFLIGVLGSVAGLGLTWLVLYFREPIVEVLVGRETLAQFYHFAHLPVKYELADALKACAFSTVLCTLAGVLPAIRASLLKSSEAMRNE